MTEDEKPPSAATVLSLFLIVGGSVLTLRSVILGILVIVIGIMVLAVRGALLDKLEDKQEQGDEFSGWTIR